MNSMKRQKDMILDDGPPKMLLEKSRRQLPIAPERMRWLGTSLWKQCSVADVSAGESKI